MASFILCGDSITLESAFDFLRQRDGIANAVAAEIRADAALACAERFRVRVAAGHVEVFPDIGQVFLLDAQQIDALAAGELDHRHLILHRDFGDAHQFRRRRYAAVNARDDGERAVLLDVGVNAVVDESRVALVFVLVGPEGFQQRCETNLAGRVFLTIRQLHEHFAHGLDAATPNLCDELRFLQRQFPGRNSVRWGRMPTSPR